MIAPYALRILTWNVERPKTDSATKNAAIIDILKRRDADIVILTETNSAIDLSATHPFSVSSRSFPDKHEGYAYSEGENRTTIFSRFPLGETIFSNDPYTTICSEVKTPYGQLIVYGTIIGICGNNDRWFKRDLDHQLSDVRRFANQGNICFAGDYNISFTDNFYFTKYGRQEIEKCFAENGIENVTAILPNNIDHIAISKAFLEGCTVTADSQEVPKNISDHKVVWVTLTPKGTE